MVGPVSGSPSVSNLLSSWVAESGSKAQKAKGVGLFPNSRFPLTRPADSEPLATNQASLLEGMRVLLMITRPPDLY